MPKVTKHRLSRVESRLETKKRLKESAAQVFARGGYEGASVDMISEHAGYSKGAFYSNYESKEAIFLELLDAYKQREIDGLAQIIALEIPAEEMLTLIRQFQAGQVSDLDLGLLSAEFQLQACRDKAFAKAYATLHRAHRDTLAGLINKLFAKIGRPPPAPSQDLAEIVMGLIAGLSLQRSSGPGTVRKDFVTEAILLVLGIERR